MKHFPFKLSSTMICIYESDVRRSLNVTKDKLLLFKLQYNNRNAFKVILKFRNSNKKLFKYTF